MIDGKTLVAIATLVLSAGTASLVIAGCRGLWVWAQARGPRARVEAIRFAAETLDLLEPGSAEAEAVAGHLGREAAALSPKPGSIPRDELLEEAIGVSDRASYRALVVKRLARHHNYRRSAVVKAWGSGVMGAAVITALAIGASRNAAFQYPTLALAGGCFSFFGALVLSYIATARRNKQATQHYSEELEALGRA